MAEPIDLLFGSWPRVGWKKHKFNHIRQVVPMCPHEGTFAPASEYDWPFHLRRQYALCQITLTTCWATVCEPFAIGMLSCMSVLSVCLVYCGHMLIGSSTISAIAEHLLLFRLLHFAWVVDDAKCIVVTHVCVSVCLSAAIPPHYSMDPDVTWGRGRSCPLVVHYWADLQSGHG